MASLIDLVARRATARAQKEYHDRLHAAAGRWSRRYASGDDHPDWSASHWDEWLMDAVGIAAILIALLMLWR